MKKFIASIFALALCVGALAQSTGFQPQPAVNPLNVNQETYIDDNFHSVPFGIAYPNPGQVTLIFDPNTSAVDQRHVWSHMQKASANAGSAAPTASAIIPHVVNTNVYTQIYRQASNFAITSSTTLTTVPGLQANVENAGHYTFRAVLFINCGSGGGKVDFGGTASTSNVAAQVRGYGGTSILFGSLATAFLSGPAGSSSATLTEIEIDGEMDIGNGGTFVVQFAQNGTNATASQVLSGSNLTLTLVQ